ncbi:hypothetical protein ASD06_05825 [Angustibacter sp. Root456]|nr:hypothetical protein ASD06_05825 [Angustibacter sp. Root456]
MMAEGWPQALEGRRLPEWWWDEECSLAADDSTGDDFDGREVAGLRKWILLLLTAERTEGRHIGRSAVRVFPTARSLEQARGMALRYGVEQDR